MDKIEHCEDLFGEIPVSNVEVELWLYKVPRLPHYSTRRESYVRQWNVVDKIRAHKRRGALAEAIPDDLCEFCGQSITISAAYTVSADPSKELNLLKRRIQVLEALIRPGTDEKKPAFVGRASGVGRITSGA